MSTYQDNLAAAAALDLRTEAFIDGSFVPGKRNRTFDTVSPRDGRVLASVAECDESDVDIAVASARTAFEDGRWARQSPQQRRKVLARLAALIHEHRHELALLPRL